MNNYNFLRFWFFITVNVFTYYIDRVSTEQWDANSYPNPTTLSNVKQCGLNSQGKLCDPDRILSDQDRNRINYELSQMERETYQQFGADHCSKQGLVLVIGLAQNVRGGSEQDVKRMATELRQRWKLDPQCQKGVVVIVSVGDRKHWVSRDEKVPVYAGDFASILKEQTPLFQQRNYNQALLNLIHGTRDVVKNKQGKPIDTGGGGSRGLGPSSNTNNGKGTPGLGGLSEFKLPKIPLWVVLTIVFVVVPLLICCCICYCCCCRSKSNNNHEEVPSNDPDAPPGHRSGGAGGLINQARSFLAGAGGGMLMNFIQNFFRNRSRGGAAPAPGADSGGERGGYVPPRSGAVEEGHGLYPSKAVKDEGAGGGW